MDDDREGPEMATAGYRQAGAEETVRGNRRWWDEASADYLEEHGDFLGDDDFVWCPEGLREAEAQVLGDPAAHAGRLVLEVGSGAGQCARWFAARGADVVALDLSGRMLREGRARSASDDAVAYVEADARALPFPDAAFDLAFSAYGAVPFVADPERIMTEVARVLRPGGTWAFSLTHPVRWAFPDDPTEHGLTATRSYFDRTPYVEEAADGEVVYAEHHRTLGDRVRDVVAAGLVLVDLVEPEWPDGHDRVWGGWSPLRGRHLPGTAILVCRKP